MNKRMTLGSCLIVFSSTIISSFGMHNKVLLASKCISACLVVSPGLAGYYSYEKKKKKSIYRDPMPKDVQEWARETVDEYDLPEKSRIYLSIESGNRAQWAKTIDGDIVTSAKEAKEVQDSLSFIKNAQNNDLITDVELERAKKLIAWHQFCLRHECGHKYYQHSKKHAESLVL